MERVTGIEPAWPAWKAGALPLSYTRIFMRAVNLLSTTLPRTGAGPEFGSALVQGIGY